MCSEKDIYAYVFQGLYGTIFPNIASANIGRCDQFTTQNPVTKIRGDA